MRTMSPEVDRIIGKFMLIKFRIKFRELVVYLAGDRALKWFDVVCSSGLEWFYSAPQEFACRSSSRVELKSEYMRTEMIKSCGDHWYCDVRYSTIVKCRASHSTVLLLDVVKWVLDLIGMRARI